MADTKERLVAAAITVLVSDGLAGASARSIAAAAGVNQALVFYHFGTVDQLLSVACRQATEQRVVLYRDRLAAVSSIGELLDVGRQLQVTERAEGNFRVLAQLLAGAQTDERLAPAVGAGLQLWVAEIESVLARVTATSPVADLIDVRGLARVVASTFIGLELYGGVDPAGSAEAVATLEQLAVLVEVVDGLGPVARRALRTTLRRAAR
ncbi:TetR/AcrR family transcriptional regulator [Dactylosporangium aurantiacum]|uniref:TetR/AcrR family transcriptional regulator n=1 Tax=Dactylosporangium aurantiacum TaxID=35754 RepID=A0A9Q9MF35_9ACTN|nr:TetR/AcrR family transcriptional regulator [Dactylosporangium aurantiacum]MDG6103324.1 TetR/AcrR family transcriptional regulator [Dactylosporangium aurantiacum]UWZ52150.1 TetR/AcrR family transcriptional regulator [Dactylosporangium aurantiacum]